MKSHEEHLFISYLKDIFFVVFGNILYSIAVAFFILPGNLITGGTTGIGLFLNTAFHVPLSLFILGFNTALFLMGFIILGKKFAATTAISTFFYPITLNLIQRLLGDFTITKDPLLCTIFGGVFIGLSLGIVIRIGASTGGMDIPPMIINKFWGIPISYSMYVFDIIILLLQIPFHNGEEILYGIILIAVYTFVLNECLMIGVDRIEMKVISKKSSEIQHMILQDIDRGVTILHGRTGYLDRDTELVLSVVNKKELPISCRRIKMIDPNAFIIISKVTEVRGRGFSDQKKYREKEVDSRKSI